MENSNHLPAAAPLGTIGSSAALKFHVIRDETCVVEAVPFHNPSPTGEDILIGSGRPADADQVVLQILRAGGAETIRLHEHADLSLGTKFILANGDRLYLFTIDDEAYEWPYRLITEQLLRELAGASDHQQIEVLRHGVATPVLPQEPIDLSEAGVEKFIKVDKVWKLKVQGVLVEFKKPKVTAEEALARAGFPDPKPWQILLVTKDGTQEVAPDDVIDLRAPGIEKIRLMKRSIINGDGQQPAARRSFKLLPDDDKFLDGLGHRWETVLEGDRRWLLIHDFQLPAGYAPSVVTLALDIHKDYPAAQIDMFYFYPSVRRASGAEIPSTQVRATIGGMEFQGWSRHRTDQSKWDEHTDNVRSHMVLVDTCLCKELGE